MLTTASHTHLAEALDGAVVLPDDPRWDEARSSFNLLVDQRPAAVAFPSDARDVAAAVALRAARSACASRRRRPATTRRRSATWRTRSCSTSAACRTSTSTPARGSVRVGAGVKWDRVAPRLSAHGLAGLHGSSPDVGIAGYSLGGGMGWLARKYGLQTNAVTALELVTADGELVRVDAEHEPDLFWALRGGGGNFGVVTAIEFERRRGRGALRGRAVLPVRARGRGAAHVERDPRPVPRRAHVVGVAAALPADPRRARRSRAGARTRS